MLHLGCIQLGCFADKDEAVDNLLIYESSLLSDELQRQMQQGNGAAEQENTVSS
jgi:hypothetical protein